MEHHLPCDPSDISRTLFILGTYRRWRTAALFTSDGSAGEIKPEWGEDDYQHGQDQTIQIALDGMLTIARSDRAG